MIYLVGIPRLFYPEDMRGAEMRDVLKWLEGKSEVQCDIETDLNTRNKKALSNPYENKMLCLQLGDASDQYIIDPNTTDISSLKAFFEDKTIVKLFTNASFDLRFLFHHNFDVQNVYDCFLAELSITLGKDMPKGYRGLGSMVERHCGYKLDKTVRGEIQARGLDDTVLRYSAEDVVYMSEIKTKQEVIIKELELENTIKLENRFILTLARISYKGFKVDAKKVLQISKDNQILCAELKTKLNNFVIDLNDPQFIDRQLDLFDEKVTCKINWRSSQQVVALFQKLGINTLVRNKSSNVPGAMKHSVEGKHLSRQKKEFPILSTYLEYKEVEKEISTYGEKFIRDNMNPVTGKMHSEFFPILETGRISSSNPNLQNITATDGGESSPLRSCFIAETDKSLIISDYSGQEVVVLADKCKDPYLIDCLLNKGGDTHSMTGTLLSPYLLGEKIEVSKKNNPIVPRLGQKIRDISKVINLKLNYGGTAFTLKDDLTTTQEEAQALIDLLDKSMPEKKRWAKEQGDFIKKNGYVIIDGVTKRRSYFPQYDKFIELGKIHYDAKTKEQRSDYYKLRGQIERMGANCPIQGVAANQMKVACIMFEDKIKSLGLNAYIVNIVHDELVIECETSIVEQVKNVLEESMIASAKLFCPDIPMKLESYIGQNWSAKH